MLKHCWVCVLGNFPTSFHFLCAGAILSLNLSRTIFPATFFYLLAILKTRRNGVYVSEPWSDQNDVTGHALFGSMPDLEHTYGLNGGI